MNAHDVAEHARLLSHQLYANLINDRPELLDDARGMITAGIADDGGTTGHRLWDAVLLRPWPEIRAKMLDGGPEGRLLRSDSQFSTLIGVTDPEQRRALWRRAKQELSDRSISSERSAA